MSRAVLAEDKKGQVAIVTGGGNGIGLGVAERFLAEGADVALFDVNQDALTEARAELEAGRPSGRVLDCVVDVTSEDSIEAAVQAVVERFGRVDILVQAAGVVGKTGIQTHEVESANFSFVMDVNLLGIFHCCKAVLPHMLKQNYGRIVNIASIAGKEGNSGMLAYSASKAGVLGLTKVVGKDYAETGITCNAVTPAVVRTKMVAAMPDEQVKYMTDKIPMKRTGEVDEMASLVSFIASSHCSFTTGFAFDATGGRATY